MELRTRKILAAVLGIFIFCALLAFSILHFRLVDLKEVFLTKVSSEFTSRIGQEVRIEGVTIGPLSAITFHQAVIKSTNNFEQTFLTIKKIRIHIRLGPLLKKKLSINTRISEEGKATFDRAILKLPSENRNASHLDLAGLKVLYGDQNGSFRQFGLDLP